MFIAIQLAIVRQWSNVFYIQGGGTPIYRALQSSSSVKMKVKSQAKNLQLVKGQTRFVIVYHNRYFYLNVKLQKYTGIRSKVKCNFKWKSRVKAYFWVWPLWPRTKIGVQDILVCHPLVYCLCGKHANWDWWPSLYFCSVHLCSVISDYIITM